MKKNVVIKWDLYPYDVMLSVGETTDDVVRRLKRLRYKIDKDETDDLNMSNDGRTVMLKGGQTVIRLKDFQNNGVYIALLAHEALHAVFFLMNKVGITYGEDSDEAYTYALQWLMSTLLHVLKEKQ
jgi:hypothetical protein